MLRTKCLPNPMLTINAQSEGAVQIRPDALTLRLYLL